MDNEPLSNVDRYGEVDGPLPFLPNANFMPHWFFQWGFFILMKWLKFYLNKNKNSPDATLISSRLSYMSSDMVWIRIKTRYFKRGALFASAQW